jgi:hypothetical protein
VPFLVGAMAWTGEHRAFVVEEYIRNGGSAISTQRAFRIRFKLGRHDYVPDRKTMLVWMSNFRATGSALKKKPPGRPLTITSPENVARVRASIQKFPRRSAVKHAAALGLSDRSVKRILHRDLHMHPYKMMITQALSERDFETRRAVCKDILQNIPAGNVLISSDEAHFHMSGIVNKQNFRYWAVENPQKLYQRSLQSPYVTVWCAVSDFGVLGPYFFEENGLRVTVNSDRYCHMIETFLRPNLNQIARNHVEGEVWFQQDGATAHTSRRSLDILRELFPGRLLSLRGDITWPPKSPDLSPCDYFLWGYLKAQVYKHRPTILQTLKEAITQEVAAITPAMTKRVMENFRERLRQCISKEGRYLTDVMFKTK